MSISRLKLVLPFPPSVNHYWRSPIRGKFAGRCLVSKRGRAYRKHTVPRIARQLCTVSVPIRQDLCVSVVLFPPTKAKRDIDNYFKALFDSVTHAKVWNDDNQVKKLKAQWGPVVKKGKVLMEIYRFGS